MIAVAGPSITITVGATTTRAAIVMPDPTMGGIHFANCGTGYVSVYMSQGGTTAVLGTGITIPANGQLLLQANARINTIDCIGSVAGNMLICTPVAF